jgi:zinc protease
MASIFRPSVSITTFAAAALAFMTMLVALKPHPARALEPVQRVVSAHGIQALLIESREVGIMSLRFSFEGGGDQDPADKLGAAYFAAYLFNEGAGDFDAKALAAKLSRIGAGFAGDANLGSISFTFTTPSAHRDEAVSLLKLAMTSPRFDNEPIERARRAALANLKQEAVAPGSVAMRRLSGMLHGSSRYAQSIYGTPQTLDRISVDDIRAVRKRIFARSNLRVAAAGDIDAKSLATLLDEVFGSLPAAADITPSSAPEPVVARQEMISMDLPQTIVLFANNLPRLDGKSAHAASVFNQILSASFTGRLFQIVREKEGLVYSVATNRLAFPKWDMFWGSLGAAPDKAERAFALTMREIDRLVKDGPSAQELEDAKSALRGSTYLGLDTSANLSAMLLWMLERKLPDTFIADYDAAIASITIDDVRAAGQVLFHPECMVSVSVGKSP